MNALTAYQSQQTNVAKYVSSTKVKYSWFFSFDFEYFELNLFVSKWSKKHRIFLNHQPVLETDKNFTTFYFKIIIYDGVFELLKGKTDEEYHLKINGEPYERIALNTSNNKPFEDFKKNQPNARLVCNFTVEPFEGYYKFIRGDMTEMSIILPEDGLKGGRASFGNSTQIGTTYNMLDNSGNFYSHELMYMANKEEHEDPEIVKTARDGI